VSLPPFLLPLFRKNHHCKKNGKKEGRKDEWKEGKRKERNLLAVAMAIELASMALTWLSQSFISREEAEEDDDEAGELASIKSGPGVVEAARTAVAAVVVVQVVVGVVVVEVVVVLPVYAIAVAALVAVVAAGGTVVAAMVRWLFAETFSPLLKEGRKGKEGREKGWRK
jgi:hypothetical protein